MPQKSNPITSELIRRRGAHQRSLLSALHNAQIQEHERGTHGWQVEWLTLPQMITLTGGALKHAVYLAKNLQVDAAAMRANISSANDVILAEAAVFALANAMPRPQAEELVKKACVIAVAENKPLIEIVRAIGRRFDYEVRSTGRRWRDRIIISARAIKLSTECSKVQLKKAGGFSNPPKERGH